jgi:hypothetical protein
MVETNLLTWAIIIFLDVFSILIGFYSGYKFIRAFLDGKNLMRYQSYLITAFILIIIIPLFLTILVPKILPSEGKYSQVGIVAESSNNFGDYGHISFPNERMSFSANKPEVFDLVIKNEFNEEKKLSIDISCLDSAEKCQSGTKILTPNINQFNVNPKIIFQLPITINITNEIPPERYNFEILINNEDGSTYDKIPLTISVETK